VLGLDGCRSGWAGLVWDGTAVGGVFGTTIDVAVSAALAEGPIDVIGVDMPIGLPDSGRRRADLLARAALGPRRSSVFVTATRAALAGRTRGEADALNRARGGQGVTAQAFHLGPKIAEVDAWVRDGAVGLRVVEVHPELSFAELAGGEPLADAKRTWAGASRRRALLRAAGLDLDGVDLGPVGREAAADDVVDAAAAAWSAMRVARGTAVSRPDPPERFSDGWPTAIWT
jgi:predicted RNase H-like nuclease